MATIFVAGSADRILVRVGFPYPSQIWIFRIFALVAPMVVFRFTRRICRQLRASESHPLRGLSGTVVRRTPAGFATLDSGSAAQNGEAASRVERAGRPSG